MTSLRVWANSSTAIFAGRKLTRIIATLLCMFWLVPVRAQDADRDLTTTATGTHNGYYFNFWKDSGKATFGLREAGRYTAQWGPDVNNWIGGIGWNPGSSEKIVKYSGQYGDNAFANKNTYLSLYGWTRNPLVEYYIIESWGSYNPSSCSGGTSFGTYQSDGATYELRRCKPVIQPAIDGYDYTRYYAVRNPKKGFGQISGTITVADHFNIWASKGLTLGKPDYMIFATEGYQSAGSVDMTVTDGALPVVPLNCGESGGVPICCRITADPDRDGTGTQNNGEICTVTEATQGWHLPNPPDVLTAINAGGKDQDELAGDIYYSPYRYGAQGVASVFETVNVAGSDGSAVYKSALFGDFTYEIPLSEQRVSVELGFVEFYQQQNAGRLFDVSIEGKRVLTNTDIFANAGYQTLWKPAPFETLVADGKLTISLTGTLGQATLSSILVRKINSSSSTSSTSSSSSSSSASSTSASSTSGRFSSSASSTSSSSGATPIAGSTGWLLILSLVFLPTFRLKKRDCRHENVAANIRIILAARFKH